MAQTVETIARTAKQELDSDINLQVIGQFVTNRISQLYAATKYKTLRKLGELYLPGALGGQTNAQGVVNPGGTVSATVGSNIITGDAVAAPLWNNTLEGQFFRIFPFKTWYRIAKVDSPSLILENLVVSENSSLFQPGVPVTGQSYYIVQRYVPAANDARFFGKFVLDYLYLPLEWISPEQMQEKYPSRFLVGPYPWCVSEFQTNLSATAQPKMLEFYPNTLISTLVHYVYWSIPPTINFYDQLPVTIDPYIAKELAFIPIMRYEMAKAVRSGQVEQAAFWRNEYRAQETRANVLTDDAIRNDSGTDDQTFIMQTTRRRRSADWDSLTTARDDVWSRNG